MNLIFSPLIHIEVGDLRDYDFEFYVPHDVAKRGKNIKFEKGGDIIFGKHIDPCRTVRR
jgi:hypothetical protein